MTGQTKDWLEHPKADGEQTKQTSKATDLEPAESVDPSTREILHMLQKMEAKS